ncbi:DUF4091 domain-containing protein, partial [Patescibacteria group bacterium]|nr:DUF4091 domain-containing protein [Patescibacteria group bacterium]
KENIVLKKVVYDKRRLMPEDYFSYALVPDRLENFSQLSVEPNSSARVWLEIRIPDKLSGGDYRGKIHIKQDGKERTALDFKVTVLPLVLNQPKATAYTWGDPANNTYANNTENLFDFYRNYQLTTIISLHPNDYRFIENNGSVVNVDFKNLERRINYYQSKGILKENQPVSLWVFAEDLYKRIYQGFDFSDKDLYVKLSSREYSGPFGMAVKNLIEIAKRQNINFVFEVADEPDTIEERIYADRIMQFVKENGGITAADLTAKSEQELAEKDISPFFVPHSNLPLKPLSQSSFLDNKVWNLTVQGEAFKNNYSNNYGYYTTRDSYLRTPINNRFLHGLLAYKTEAKFVYAYAAGAWWNDPYRDFDIRPNWPLFTRIEPDRVFVYPTASGELIPAMNAEGLREGIKDAKYIATLKNLIKEQEKKITHPNGSLIKVEGDPAIYLIENDKKRPIPSWSVFASQFNSRAVIIVSSSEVNNYPLGDPLKYQEGTLFRTRDNSSVYVVENGKKRLIPSPQIFEGMGYNWGEIIIAEDNNILGLHPKGEDIAQAKVHPNGTLVKTVSSSGVYLLGDAKKRLIISPSIFNSRFVSWGRIITINQTEMDSYPQGDNLSYRDGTIFKLNANPAVYVVESQKKRPIASPFVFNRLGYKWENIVIAEDESIANLHPTGEVINF